ncbi:hypothetical protein [Xenophilus sp.]|uniref:hypothetical protein n=1 Tax=Xenophilus sp. TaxID=1873499 RepID=UPI0037DCF786
MEAWDCLLLLSLSAWHRLDRFYGLVRDLGAAGCALAVAMGWLMNRWGLRLTARDPWTLAVLGRAGRAGPLAAEVPRRLLGRLLQIGGTALTSIAMLAMARSMAY